MQGLPEDAAEALREELLAKAEVMFPVRKRNRKAAAAVAGLGACALYIFITEDCRCALVALTAASSKESRP